MTAIEEERMRARMPRGVQRVYDSATQTWSMLFAWPNYGKDLPPGGCSDKKYQRLYHRNLVEQACIERIVRSIERAYRRASDGPFSGSCGFVD